MKKNIRRAFFRFIYHVLISFLIFIFKLFPSENYQLNLNQQKRFLIKAVVESNVDYLSLTDFAACLGTKMTFDDRIKSAIIKLGSSEIRLFAANPFININYNVFQMPVDTRFLNNQIYVPIKFFIELLQNVKDIQIRLNESSSQIDVFYHAQEKGLAGITNISRIDIDHKINGILITIHTTVPFKQSEVTTRVRQEWLYVDIYNGVIDSFALSQTPLKGIFRGIIPLQPSGNLAQISFHLSQQVTDVKAVVMENSHQILVTIRTQEELPSTVLKALENDRLKWQIDKIAIDPGHGGRDPGAIGPSGVQEKDVVLNIARYLKKLVESRLGIEVIMTREDDRFIPLHQRTAIANRNNAKLFISIHANSNRDRKVDGVSTYILGPAKTNEAVEVAQLENSVIQYEASYDSYPNLDNEQFILSSIAQSEFTRESEELAALVQEEVSNKTDLRDRGVKQAGYLVLVGASMPNILFESAFISNRKEEKKLKSSDFQKDLAESLFESIKKFKIKYEQSHAASRSM
ncbi:N-acetylmuramoyl-L-alanine amidase [candidate division KSB1 bacterium]|nr:N-acetylmuramoyl-L-alanine amidase [candidate division KSB1 bacterium]